MYKLIRSILFLFDAEAVHYFSMNSLKNIFKIPFAKKLICLAFKPTKKNLPIKKFNITFKNKVGLAAGFDKNAQYLNELECIGFGFIEIGTVTPKPQAGNDKPRLLRLAKDKAVINRMGFNNDGVETIAARLKEWKGKKNNNTQLVIGGNIGKNKTTPNEDAWKDYEICFTTLFDVVDYFVVNVSSPNTPGLRELQEKESLRKILTTLQSKNNKQPSSKPILLKIAPDLYQQQIDDIIDLALEIKLDGLITTNTTLDRNGLSQTSKIKSELFGTGGLSGLPLQKKSTEIVQYIYTKTNGQIPIIASGGIFNGADANEKINAGASLVQVWTGFIYEGPAIVKNICKELI